MRVVIRTIEQNVTSAAQADQTQVAAFSWFTAVKCPVASVREAQFAGSRLRAVAVPGNGALPRPSVI
jgi:hypothetical protein